MWYESRPVDLDLLRLRPPDLDLNNNPGLVVATEEGQDPQVTTEEDQDHMIEEGPGLVVATEEDQDPQVATEEDQDCYCYYGNPRYDISRCDMVI